MKRKISILLALCMIMVGSMNVFAVSKTASGNYNGHHYELSCIADSSNVSASMYYSGGGTVRVEGFARLYLSEFYWTDESFDVSADRTVTATVSSVIGNYLHVEATGYVGKMSVDFISFDM